jgi:hypothetical protein
MGSERRPSPECATTGETRRQQPFSLLKFDPENFSVLVDLDQFTEAFIHGMVKPAVSAIPWGSAQMELAVLVREETMSGATDTISPIRATTNGWRQIWTWLRSMPRSGPRPTAEITHTDLIIAEFAEDVKAASALLNFLLNEGHLCHIPDKLSMILKLLARLLRIPAFLPKIRE